MEKWRRQLSEALGYLELGLLSEAARVMEEIDPAEHMRYEVQALIFLRLAFSKNLIVFEIDGKEKTIKPTTPDWWVAASIVAREGRSLAHAEAILLMAETLHPDDPQILYHRARYACLEMRFAEAKTFLSRACGLSPEILDTAVNEPDLEAIFHQWTTFERSSSR